MDSSRTTSGSSEQALRDMYLRTGKVPWSTMLRVGLRDALVQPFWLPIKHLPGGVGMKLRGMIYRALMAKLGPGSLVDIGVDMKSPQRVSVGAFSLIDKYVMFEPGDGNISIGDRCHIAPWALIFGHGGVIIEDYVGIAAGSKLFSISEWPGKGLRVCGPMVPSEQRGLKRGQIKIERDVLIGAGSVVMPGITVGRGAVVGSNSVVTRDVPPWTIAAGNPARAIAPRDPVTVEDLPVPH